MKKLKVLDLFSGIGAFSLGLERTGGFETVAFCEIEPFCRAVLAKHWPDVRQYDDVRELTGIRLDRDGIRPNVICGGFPCQDISIAGDRRGLAGERSGLWAHMLRLVFELRPMFVIVENTTGLLDLGLGDVLGGLATLGYDAVWHSIPASAAGAAHQRDRLWIIAHDCRQRWRIGADDYREYAKELIQNLNRELAVSLASLGEQQSNADPLACVGARIPDGGEARAAYVRAALCRKSDGLPHHLDALAALGNSAFPEIPYIIGKAIQDTLK